MIDDDKWPRFVTPDDLAMMAVSQAVPTEVQVMAAMALTADDLDRMFGLPASRIVPAVGLATGTGVARAVAAPSPAERRRTAACERQRAHRARQADGVLVCRLPVDPDLIDAMVGWRWIGEWDADDPAKIAEALVEGLREAATHDRLKRR
jgi:hypothetical protein